MGGRGSQGARLKSSLRGGAPSPLGVAAVGFVLACLGHSREAREARRLRCTPVERAKIGSGREFRPDGKHLASRARLFDPEPRAPAGSGTNPQTRFTAHPVRSP